MWKITPDTAGEGDSQGRHPLDLVFVNREGLVGVTMVGSHPGHSSQATVEFSVLGELRRRVNRAATFPFHLLNGRL